jgi:Thioredoxin
MMEMMKLEVAKVTSKHSYAEYRKLIQDLFDQGKVTGNEQTQAYLDYTKLNIARMNRVEKTFVPSAEIANAAKKISKRFDWLIITEGWCGDSAQILPALEKTAIQIGNIQTHYLLRDDHPDIMQMFLTNGSRSIPKIICLAESGEVLWTWGPRPKRAVEIMAEAKEAGLDTKQVKEKLHGWYAANKGEELQKEWLALLNLMI